MKEVSGAIDTYTSFLAARSAIFSFTGLFDPVNSSLRLSRPSPFTAPKSRSVPKFDHSRLFTLLLNYSRATLPHGRPRPRPSPDAASPPCRRGRTQPAPSSCASLATPASEESRARFHEPPSTEHQSPLHLAAFILRFLVPSVAPPLSWPFR